MSDALIIQLNIFKFIDGISKKVVPTLIIDEEISLWGNTMSLSGIVYHEGEQSHSGHYTSGVKINDSWVLISDSVVLRQHNLSCTKRDAIVPYILLHKKRNDIVHCFSTSLNDTSESSSITQVLTELRAEMMNRQSVLNELEKLKKRMTIAAQRKDGNNAKHASQPDICKAARYDFLIHCLIS